MTTEYWLDAIVLAFAIGILVGNRLEGNRWAANAKTYIRKEYRGRLYKVSYD